MIEIDPGQLAAAVRALHGYALNPAGATRAAQSATIIAAAVDALAPGPQFHEEPAGLAPTLAALAPDEG